MRINKNGFTLVELMAVIAILGILSGVVIMAVSSYTEKSRKEVYKNFVFLAFALLKESFSVSVGDNSI